MHFLASVRENTVGIFVKCVISLLVGSVWVRPPYEVETLCGLVSFHCFVEHAILPPMMMITVVNVSVVVCLFIYPVECTLS